MDHASRGGEGHDAPIKNREDDLLGGYRVAHAMHRVLATAPSSWSTRLALYGAWGSGKTSILNLLKEIEEQDGTCVLNFSAWSAGNHVIASLYEAFASKLKEEGYSPPLRQRAKKAIRWVKRPFGFLWPGMKTAAVEFTPVPSVITKTAADALGRMASAATSWAKPDRSDVDAVRQLLVRRRVVVFIDDLDRADPKIIPKTLLALREILDWPGIAFVVAMDRRAIATALGDYSNAFGEDAQGFLDKVVDVPFFVPEPDDRTRKRFASSVMRECCDSLPSAVLDSIATVLPRQPRRVKLVARMLGALQPALSRHTAEEIDWLGLLLYLLVKEGSTRLSDWLVATCSVDEREDWLLWLGDKDQRQEREDATRQTIIDMLDGMSLPDQERIVRATFQLLEHWQFTPSDQVAYWSGLVYQEPAITLQEFVQFRAAYAGTGDTAFLESLVMRGATAAGVSETEAAAAVMKTALTSYERAIATVADAATSIEFTRAIEVARLSLSTLEHLWREKGAAICAARSELIAVSELFGIVRKWIGWNRTSEEAALRQREKALAACAVSACQDPWGLFAATDPFWNRDRGADAEDDRLVTEWRTVVRQLLIPAIAARFTDSFRIPEGLAAFASGDDDLGAWLVERKDSPLYNDKVFTNSFLTGLRSVANEPDDTKAVVARNCLLFLRQVLRQTRQSMWGGIEEAKEACLQRPELIAAAWAAVVSVPVPHRMRASIRKVRANLEALGISPAHLVEPGWLTEHSQPDSKLSEDPQQ
ncbi:P-loop NTPase fold protein [Cupriavidus sp. amp6]|uniref:KAP family P-loop NTPase fold protein n=1 Tax=Cupriavidus sp. amp6 TaxID=388051 RepID=UPI000426DCB2|nr:P-loop NTPase fold protein [Cupriavidus sp. amp6]